MTFIPKQIFQTWCTKDLPPGMSVCVQKLKSDNPEFTHYLFDDSNCENYIKKYFSDFEGVNVHKAYLKLIPGAYKADLWRLCVLYREGGVYLDIKFKCVNDFKFIDFINKNYFSRDIEISGSGIYNGIMITKSNNHELKKAIFKIVDNINNYYYGLSALKPTGPLALKNIIKKDVDSYHQSYNGKQIIKEYDNYRNELNQFSILPHYYSLWYNRRIYVINIPKIIYMISFDNKFNYTNIKINKNICYDYKFIYYNLEKSNIFMKKYYSKKINEIWKQIDDLEIKK